MLPFPLLIMFKFFSDHLLYMFCIQNVRPCCLHGSPHDPFGSIASSCQPSPSELNSEHHINKLDWVTPQLPVLRWLLTTHSQPGNLRSYVTHLTLDLLCVSFRCFLAEFSDSVFPQHVRHCSCSICLEHSPPDVHLVSTFISFLHLSLSP